MKRRFILKMAVCALVLCAIPLLTQPLYAQQEKTQQMKVEIPPSLFIGGEACLGEPVIYTSTLHLVIKDGQISHGNQINAEAYGLVTGSRFVVGGSPANLVPAGDGYYLYHLTFNGTGDNPAKFSITAKGEIDQPAVEIIQEQCVHPGL